MRAGVFAAAILLALAGCGGASQAGGNTQAAALALPTLTGRVVDQANLLPPADEERLAQASTALEHDVGPQFVIATVPSLQGRRIEDYSVQLARSWGIGSAVHNDGVLLLVAPAERKVRIEVGYGLERRVTDPFAARVIREQMIPRFQAGDFAAGIAAGSAAIIARLRSPMTERQIAAEDHLLI